MTGIYAIIGIVMLVFGILQIVLFFKLWGMTNDVGQIKGLLSNLSTQKATAAMSSHDLEQTSSEQKTEQKVVGGMARGNSRCSYGHRATNAHQRDHARP